MLLETENRPSAPSATLICAGLEPAGDGFTIRAHWEDKTTSTLGWFRSQAGASCFLADTLVALTGEPQEDIVKPCGWPTRAKITVYALAAAFATTVIPLAIHDALT